MDLKCNVCKGPWHEATGHRQSATMLWCGPCTRKWVKFLKSHLNRKSSGVHFYDHAQPPPAVAPVGFRPEDVQDPQVDVEEPPTKDDDGSQV